MYLVKTHNLQGPIADYAIEELQRILSLLCPSPKTDIEIELSVDLALNIDEISLNSNKKTVKIQGGSSRAVLHCVYIFLEKLGCVFEISGELLPPAVSEFEIPETSFRQTPGITQRGIRMHLGLNKPIYRQSAAYGHFGRQADGEHFPWERTDLVDDLKAALN